VTGPILLPLDVPALSFESGSGTTIRRTIHPSGLRILTEEIPGAMSATIGFWVGVGSRDEDHVAYGSTHFLEHLLFKGTPRRSAMEIAVAFDQVGGEHNALTAKEYTCYYAKVQDNDLPMAIDVLADMLAASTIDPNEFDIERGVILEELAMADDDPTGVAHERLAEQVLGDHPLGRPIGGSPESIKDAHRDQVMAHYHRYYRPDELVVAIAGALDHDTVVEQVVQGLRSAGWDLDTPEFPVPRRPHDPPTLTPGQRRRVISRPLEQAVVALGMPGIRAGDPRRPALGVLTTVLGGGMSSRLFQEVREKRGLAYSVYSFASQYADTGMVGMAAGTSPHHAAEVAALMRDELWAIAASGITDEELSRTIGNLSGASALALEGTESRMMRLGRSELVTGEFLDREESLRRLGVVSLDDVQHIAQEMVSGPLSATAVGPLDDAVFSQLDD
jgi:predicted Zn-dependent peptidase